MKSVILIYRWFIAFLIMTITGGFSLVLIILSLGYLRNFCVKYILKYSSRLILLLMGFKGEYPDFKVFPKYPVLYTFNHSSYLDIFLLTGMGLPNLRFILSETTLKFVPLVISAKAIGTFYIPGPLKTEKRVKFFKRMTNFLKRSNYSIAASSEGVHDYFHGIAPFNKGIYHMAMEANLPVVALYLHIPEESNPMKGNKEAKGGKIKLEYLTEFDTSDWNLSNLREKIENVRSHYISHFNEVNPEQVDSNAN